MRLASTRRTIVAAILSAVSLSACGGGDSGSSGPSGPTGPVLTTMAVTINPGTLLVGQTVTASATGLDQSSLPIALGSVTWTSANTSVVTVSQTGLVTAIGAGTTTVTATSGTKSGQATVAVLPPVATVVVTPPSVSLSLGGTQQMSVQDLDAAGNPLNGRTVTWSTSDATKATVSASGLVIGLSTGTATITATSEGKTGTAAVTINPGGSGNCTAATALQLAVGDIKTLTAAQIASLCIGGLASSSEYVVIPFNNSTNAASSTSLTMTSSNTVAVTTTPDLTAPTLAPTVSLKAAGEIAEASFRSRERSDLGSLDARARLQFGTARALSTSRPKALLTGVAANPAVGTVVQLNSNLNGNTCSAAKISHPARVVAVLQHTIVFIDTLAPAGGYTDAELQAFGTAFDTLGYGLDTLNFGAPSDIDSNGRVAIFFTQGINDVPVPPGSVLLGIFGARDLFSATPTGCTASNEGEMFYIPVPDPNATINTNYRDKTKLAPTVISTLVHEFQHLINAGRRLYVNAGASSSEEVWLNEGLSHIAEELLFYKESGLSPRTNIALSNVQSSLAAVTAFNNDESANYGRLSTYLQATATNSPYSEVDALQMRGAIWQLLRYSADRKGGTERSTWFALVNSLTQGQTNFNAVFGDIITNTHDWSIAQFVDDDNLSVAANFTNPSWNFRSVYSGLSGFPLAVTALLNATPINLAVVGGGAAYVRFGINAGIVATIASISSGAAVPANVQFTLVRTK